LPEYEQARRGTTMLEACLTPDLVAELTLQPVRRHGVDAAIFFSDIVVPLKLAGVAVDIRPGVGPVLDRPYDTACAIAELTERDLPEAALSPIRQAVALTVAGLAGLGMTDAPTPLGRSDATTSLIGFAGAPFTVAAYLVEGRPSRDHLAARRLMHADPASWRRLTTWVAGLTGQFLAAQVESGAAAVQLFDSWAGSLSRADYVEHVAPASVSALRPVAGRVPTIHFGVGAGHLLTALRDVLTEAGAVHRAVGVDYRTPLDQAVATLGPGVAVQGNIDPALLAAPWPVLERHVRDVVARGARPTTWGDDPPQAPRLASPAALSASPEATAPPWATPESTGFTGFTGAPGHVVNLGHGVPPDTDPAVLGRIVDLVHGLDWRDPGSLAADTAGGHR